MRFFEKIARSAEVSKELKRRARKKGKKVLFVRDPDTGTQIAHSFKGSIEKAKFDNGK